ncbi:hypothetical protein [Halobacterium rubrum]|uniref:hypothetical protein n=1 Tax=Halobacterium TaxID=2239 RepID=UPI001F48ADB7|nr:MULTISPECIES: hypothetical protein [Halobacterium]MDH5018962.1 hypothetical protein [Halobacterium rubrum]
MGEFADTLHEAVRDALAARDPSRDWQTEWYVRRTPVDVAGMPDDSAVPLVLVELEVRRADPANNTVKLARYADAGDLDGPVRLVQVFTDYYDLETGVSSKRENAEFVGDLAADSIPSFDYDAVSLSVAPPKRGTDPPADWRDAIDAAAAEMLD